MAMMPAGAELIENPVSGAPGFSVENVFVMAGVPRIMQGMIDSALSNIKGGAVVQSVTVELDFPESAIAAVLSGVQERYYPDVDIGSYPQYKEGKYGVNVVLRSVDIEKAEAAADEVRVGCADL